MEQQIPYPELPQGPPISYRGVNPNADPRVHRSFSQRAKTRPFADEAFADDYQDDNLNHDPAPPRLSSSGLRIQNPLTSNPPQAAGPVARTIDSRDQQRLSQNIVPSDPRPRTKIRIGNRNAPQTQPDSPSQQENLNDVANQNEDNQRNWAADRSPLQKLEVKLTDISKEEKRARVQEAEMRLRDSQNSQTPRTSRADGATRSSSNSAPLPRQLSQRTSERSAGPPNPTTPNARSRPVVAVGDAYPHRSRQQPQNRSLSDDRARNVAHFADTQQPYEGKPQTGVRTSQPPFAIPTAPARSTSARQSAGLPSNITRHSTTNDEKLNQIQRAVSLPQRRANLQDSSRAVDRPISERERNASHQAALQQLVGNSTASDRQKKLPRLSGGQQTSMSDRPPKSRSNYDDNSPVAADIGTLAGDDLSFNGAPRNISQQTQSTPPRSHRGLPTSTDNTPPRLNNGQSAFADAANLTDSSKTRQRRSSVSFKEPFDRRRPIDEWKSAETAQLVADDFLVEQVKPAETGEKYKAWWEQDQTPKGRRAQDLNTREIPSAKIDDRTATFSPRLHVKCGPLLRYAGMYRTKANAATEQAGKEYWRGTVMIVTQDSLCSYEQIPTLRLFSQPKKLLPPPPALVTGDQLAPEYIDPIAGLTKLSRTGNALYVRPVEHIDEAKDLSRIEDDNGIYEKHPSPMDGQGDKNTTTANTNKRTADQDGESLGRYREVKGVRIYADPDRDVTFWRFNIEVELRPQQQHIAYRINKGAAVGFWVPAQGQTMNMMFHTCNGFSLAVDTDSFSGPDPLWRDVLNNHQHRPFHVMIGGGDQIYNDRVMTETTHFSEWTKIKNPHHKHQAPFTPEMKEELESFYLARYSMWFSQGLFGMANASIPMVNIWDDHDIIDGFGSYPDDFMKSPVFCGLGTIAYKYYLLFQHQTVEAMTAKDERSWILGHARGPYINNYSRSLYLELGQSVGFLGLDCRTERTKSDVLSIDTLEIVLDRCRREIVEGQTKHLIVLLGVPIAYPRLVWLENMLTSRALDPIKALGRAGIVKTKLLNKFDGGVEILDDLDDHWTASHHKDERNILIQELQDLAAEKSARITILGGDVHLAAIGQFYSNPKLKIPKDRDHRYMPNVISSAIVNTPPPDMLADVLNKRNKVHHLDKYTDENMIPMFSHDVDGKKRNNNRLLPRRNWCSIREYFPGDTPPPSPSLSATDTEDDASLQSEDEELNGQANRNPKRRLSLTKEDFNPRNLMRRLSSRGEPPNAYRNSADQFNRRRASLDDADVSQNRPAPHERMSPLRSSSVDRVPDVPALRPSFHRRPTNLSEKAVRKGIMPALDAEGNEIDVNDHINLQGGLDIVINCEINQKDPAGISTPYRLLVPALWYDGSSDREKLESRPMPNRKDSILKRLGFSTRRQVHVPDSEDGSEDLEGPIDHENGTDEHHEQINVPKRGFSLFGSKRKQQNDRRMPDTHQDHPEPQFMPPAQQPQQQQQQPTSQDPSFTGTRALPATHDIQPERRVQSQPQTNQRSTAAADPMNSFGKINRAASQQHQQPAPDFSSQRSSQRSIRPLSYTISGASNNHDNRPYMRSEYSSSAAEGRPPYDPDAAYVSRQQNPTNPTSGPRSTTLSTHSNNDYPNRSNTNASIPQNTYDEPPRALRGNGIIGKNIPPPSTSRPPPVTRSSSNTMNSQDTPRGYSGIEAYKDPKPRRRWSLRDKARNLMSGIDGRRKDEDWYSDEAEEEYWEGPRR